MMRQAVWALRRRVNCLQRNRQLRERDGGFTLLETVVALAIVAVFLTALAAALITVSKANRSSASTTTASGIAADALGIITSGSYADVGFYGSDADADASFDGESSVLLAATAPDSRPGTTPVPTYTVTPVTGGDSYLVHLDITWANIPAVGANPPAAPVPSTYQGLKRVTATVTYTVGDESFSYVQQALVAP